MFPRRMNRLLLALAVVVTTTGCLKHMVIGAAADALAPGDGPGWGADDDPELIASATPFALKTIESLLDAEPDNQKLLLAACSGFAEYGYAFVQVPADLDSDLKPERVAFAHARAVRLLKRAYGYCWRGLDGQHEGMHAAFDKDAATAVAMADRKEDVPLLYWTAASLALQISLQKDKPELLGELPGVGSLGERALALDQGWDHGSIHELLEAYEASRPAAAGGSIPKAQQHRDQALAESANKKLGPLVTWAEDVDVAKQDKADFLKLCDQVLAFDVDSAPEYRLTNILAQRRAAFLKAHLDDYFA
jgi:hypothetical protein